jgi:thiol:disulfide interchange protein
MEHELTDVVERNGFTMLLIGVLLTCVSPLASLLFVVIGNTAGSVSTMYALTVGAAATFVTGLVLAAVGFSQRATVRLQPVNG